METALAQYGLLGVVLVSIAYAVRQVAIFFAPKVDDITKAHLNFVNTLAEQMPKQTHLMQTMADNQSEHGRILENIRDEVKGFHERPKD
jgi:hypothetical protein